MAKKALMLIAVVATGLALGAWILLWVFFPPSSEEAQRVLYLEQYISVAQMIVVGVVVTLVSVIIPLVLPESRDKFERYKESRQAYSRAKTAVLYLPDRVVDVDRKQAFRLVEEAHRELHFAETFEDVIKERYLEWFKNPGLWILYNYWQIVAVANVLRSQTTDWLDSASKKHLRERLDAATAVVHRRFGKRGENCVDEVWDLQDGSRVSNEQQLAEDIQQKLVELDQSS